MPETNMAKSMTAQSKKEWVSGLILVSQRTSQAAEGNKAFKFYNLCAATVRESVLAVHTWRTAGKTSIGEIPENRLGQSLKMRADEPDRTGMDGTYSAVIESAPHEHVRDPLSTWRERA